MDYGNLGSIAFPHFPENADFVSSWGGAKRPLGHQGAVPRRARVPHAAQVHVLRYGPNGAAWRRVPRGGAPVQSGNYGWGWGGAMLTPRVSGGGKKPPDICFKRSPAFTPPPAPPPTTWRVGRCTSGVPRLKYVNKLNCGFENHLRAFVPPDSLCF